MKVKCPLCPKSFQSGNDLKHHLWKIHGVGVFRHLGREVLRDE